MTSRVLDRIIGQPVARQVLAASVERPLHAYLFVGPPGSGRRNAAVLFAAALFCPHGGCGRCAVCGETLALRHPDLVLVEREGAAITIPQASEVARLALRTPRAAPYQVLVLLEFHRLGTAAPSLLKTIEEPPPSTVIIVTADSVPSDFVTVASRCARVDFRPLAAEEIASALVAEGSDRPLAEAVAKAAEGRLDRARLLAGDAGFSERIARWRELPAGLDGTGSAAAVLASELIAAAKEPVEVLKKKQGEELEALQAAQQAAGERGIPRRSEVDARHRREQRRVQTDELRAGLATLASVYEERLGAAGPAEKSAIRSLELIDEAASRLTRNVNETLLLEWLLLELDRTA